MTIRNEVILSFFFSEGRIGTKKKNRLTIEKKKNPLFFFLSYLDIHINRIRVIIHELMECLILFRNRK
jgi:hypothetical protein